MNCELLTVAGPLAGHGMLLVIGLMVLGTLALAWFRSTATTAVGVQAYLPLVLSAVLAGFLISPPHPPVDNCPTADNSLSIVQSPPPIVVGPGLAPAAVTGQVTNNGDDETFIASVEVSLEAIIPAESSESGVCDQSDYVLLDASMPVAAMLEPGESSPFAGASLGFSNKSTNQDSCKGAAIHLKYTVTSR